MKNKILTLAACLFCLCSAAETLPLKSHMGFQGILLSDLPTNYYGSFQCDAVQSYASAVDTVLTNYTKFTGFGFVSNRFAGTLTNLYAGEYLIIADFYVFPGAATDFYDLSIRTNLVNIANTFVTLPAVAGDLLPGAVIPVSATRFTTVYLAANTRIDLFVHCEGVNAWQGKGNIYIQRVNR